MRNVWAITVGCLVSCLQSGLLHSQQPDSFESVVSSAQQAQARSDFQSAAEFYKRAVALHPEIPELQANLGLMYYQIEKNELAVDAFRQAIRLKPDLFVPELFLGLEYTRLKRFGEAIPYLKRAAQSKPTDIQVHLGLGEAYTGTGNTRLAIASYLRATELAPKDANAFYHLGVSYLRQVEADARILLTQHKDSAYLQVLIADNFLDQQAFGPAGETYKKALMSSAVPVGTHASYGFVLIQQHNLQGAESELNTERKQNPGSLLAELLAARLRIEQDAADEAANAIRQIWNSDPGFLRVNFGRFKTGVNIERRSALEQALESQQSAGESSEELVALFRGDSSSAPFVNNVALREDLSKIRSGAGLYASGRYAECVHLLASRQRVLGATDLRLLAVCAYLTGDYRHAFDSSTKLALTPANEAEGLYWEIKSAQKLASEALQHASETDSGSPKLHVLLGDLYRQQKAFPDAEHEYRKALAVAPNDTGALFGLSLALLADNQLDDAFNIAQSALKEHATDPELNAVMGEIFCAKDDFAGAEPFLKKSLNTKPEYVSHVHALLGSVYAKTDRTQEAIAELKLALSDDKDGHIHYQIARLYIKVGNRKAADEAFEMSNRLRSENLDRAAVAMQQPAAGND